MTCIKKIASVRYITDLGAFNCPSEIFDVKTILSEERLEGKFIFLVSTPFSLVVDTRVNDS